MEYKLNHNQAFCSHLSTITKLPKKVIIIKCYYLQQSNQIRIVSPYLYNIHFGISNVGSMTQEKFTSKNQDDSMETATISGLLDFNNVFLGHMNVNLLHRTYIVWT